MYTYLDSCVNKRIQIWRLNEANTNKGLTIQVKNSKIVQARGKFNVRELQRRFPGTRHQTFRREVQALASDERFSR